MEENCNSRDKELNAIYGGFNETGMERGKLISEINGIIDRLKQNRRPKPDEEKQSPEPMVKIEPALVEKFKHELSMAYNANRDLRNIAERLNDLF